MTTHPSGSAFAEGAKHDDERQGDRSERRHFFLVGAFVGACYGFVLASQFKPPAPVKDWRVDFLERRIAFLEGVQAERTAFSHEGKKP